MSSVLATILSTLGAQAVPIGTGTVTGVTGADLPESVESASLPLRLLLPTGGRQDAVASLGKTFASGGQGVTVIEWELTDTLIYRALGAGLGITDLAPIVTGYCADYLSIFAPLRTPRWSVTSVRFPVIGGFEWPMGSDRWWSGVQAALTVKEIM
jgi:hypothetical protein